MDKRLGRITSVKTDRGFGFIRPDDARISNVFFHLSDLIDLPFGDSLIGQAVVFDLEQGLKGLHARRVTPVPIN